MQILDKLNSRILAHHDSLKRRFALEISAVPHKQLRRKDRRRLYVLNPGYIFVPAQATILEAVLGSGISTCLFDEQNRIGGMNHFELPGSENDTTARFADIALTNLLKMMQRAGALSGALKAQIFGGALNPQGPDRDVGQENYNVVRDWLAKEGISLIAFDIGGSKGRKVRFNSSTNQCDVIRPAEIPGDRWYPYAEA